MITVEKVLHKLNRLNKGQYSFKITVDDETFLKAYYDCFKANSKIINRNAKGYENYIFRKDATEKAERLMEYLIINKL